MFEAGHDLPRGGTGETFGAAGRRLAAAIDDIVAHHSGQRIAVVSHGGLIWAASARILGIDTDRVYATTFALNAAICGAAGALVVMTWIVHPYLGLAYTVRSFMIVVVAGLGNLGAVVAAGLGLGAAENFAGFLLGAEYQAAFVFSLLVVILVYRNYRLGRQRKYLK